MRKFVLGTTVLSVAAVMLAVSAPKARADLVVEYSLDAGDWKKVDQTLLQLDGTDNAHQLFWLPQARQLPPHVRFIVSCIDDADSRDQPGKDHFQVDEILIH